MFVLRWYASFSPRAHCSLTNRRCDRSELPILPYNTPSKIFQKVLVKSFSVRSYILQTHRTIHAPSWFTSNLQLSGTMCSLVFLLTGRYPLTSSALMIRSLPPLISSCWNSYNCVPKLSMLLSSFVAPHHATTSSGLLHIPRVAICLFRSLILYIHVRTGKQSLY